MVDHHRASRYGRYTGGPDPLAPPVDLAEALDAVAEEVMAGYSPRQALREFLRRGGRGSEGLDALAGRIQQRRRDLLGRHRLDGTLDDVRELLDTAVLEERKQLARDASMDDTERSFREMELQELPPSTAAAVNELAAYDWQSGTARDAYERIKDLLGREVLEQHFAGMKDALENATDAERDAVNSMLRDLNALLASRRNGGDTDTEFADFMARYGRNFPEHPHTLDELVDVLAARSAAAQRMMQSMSPGQRDELIRLSAQAFGSPNATALLNELEAHLRALRPDEDWSGAVRFEGQEGLGLGDGTGVLQDLADLDRLAGQLSQSSAGSRLEDLDLEALARQLGPEAVASARTLADIDRALQDAGYLQRDAEGGLRLSPRAMRRLGKTLWQDAARRLARGQGRRETRAAGASGDPTGSSRSWQFGDAEPWDVTRTLANAIRRTTAEGGNPRQGLRLALDDIEVSETEARTRAAVVLLADVSFSMASEGRWVPMKRTALALHHLVTTRFRGDRLQLVAFGRSAHTMDIGELASLPARHEQGTNLHHALLLARRFFEQHSSLQPVLLVVTDGEPTAHLLPDGDPWFSWPPDPETLRLTTAELDRLGRAGTQATFFRLGDDPGLEEFTQGMARRIGGRVVAPEAGDLGAAVLGAYLRTHRVGPGDGLRPPW